MTQYYEVSFDAHFDEMNETIDGVTYHFNHLMNPLYWFLLGAGMIGRWSLDVFLQNGRHSLRHALGRYTDDCPSEEDKITYIAASATLGHTATEVGWQEFLKQN